MSKKIWKEMEEALRTNPLNCNCMGEDAIYKVVARGYYYADEDGDEFADNYEFITSQGGGEGGAEYRYTIFKWKGLTYKVEYSYYSHQGYTYYDMENTLKRVEARKVEVTQWV